jgi:hypothetical protein
MVTQIDWLAASACLGPGLDDPPDHPDPARNLSHDSHGAASNPSEGSVQDLQQGSRLGQDNPRAELFVDIRSAEVCFELANDPSGRNGDPSGGSVRSGDSVLDLGRSERKQRRQLGRRGRGQDFGIIQMRDGRSVDDERDGLE